MATLVSYDLKGVKESFANWISNLSPAETPFTSMTGKEAVKNKYFQWQTDKLNAVADNAVAEGSQATEGALNATTILQNVTQILRKVVLVSDTANSLANYGRGQELAYQMDKAGKELKRDIEWALLNNGVASGADAKDITEPGIAISTGTSAIGGGTNSNPAGVRRTKGFTSLVAPLGTASVEDTTAIVHTNTATVGVVTEADVFGVTQSLYLAGAKPTHIMFHPKYAKFFSSLKEQNKAGVAQRFRMFDGAVSTKVNAYVSEIVDPLGQSFTLLPNRWMPTDRIYIFNPADWTQMVLREPQRIALAKDGSYEKSMIEVELGLRHRNPFASGILVVGASTGTGTTLTGAHLTPGINGITYTFSAPAGSGPVTVTVAPAATADIAITTPGTGTVASASSANPKSQFIITPSAAASAATVIEVTIDGVKYTINATTTAALAKVTAAGAVQYSNDGTTGWASTIAAADLKANTDVEYFVRVNPTGTAAADDGTYDYQFKLVASSAGDTGGSAIGGLTIINDATTQNLAKVSGKVLQSAGDNSYEISIEGKIVDSHGTSVDAAVLKGTWTV